MKGCVVCGDHYRLGPDNICSACKNFYRRATRVTTAPMVKCGNKCVFTVATRSSCRYCRWKKLKQAGYKLDDEEKSPLKKAPVKVAPPKPTPSATTPKQGAKKCAVCSTSLLNENARAKVSPSGYGYCRNCHRAFERRTDTNGRMPVLPCKETRKCRIREENRSKCGYCLMKRCFEIGLSRNGIERMSHLKKTSGTSTSLALVPVKKDGDMNQNIPRKRKHESPASSLTVALKVAKLECEVCGAESRGSRYGVLACNPCGCFFHNMLKKKRKLIKCRQDKRCKTSQCMSCRFRKCLEVGMSVCGKVALEYTDDEIERILQGDFDIEHEPSDDDEAVEEIEANGEELEEIVPVEQAKLEPPKPVITDHKCTICGVPGMV